ncbi:hypothetical protein A2U01_0064309, partial [Trifolium medium]|nr:hypothetical protein [Trifolium medium]
DLKASQESEIAKLKKDYEDRPERVKENYAVDEKKLNIAQGELISKLTKEMDEALKQEKTG